MISRLKRALAERKLHALERALVLYRCSQFTGGEWAPHSPHSLLDVLNLVLRKAGFITNHSDVSQARLSG